ncbi:MAG TPA: transcriptional repressor LexA [Treponemataceae bacterium]|jgi:repressor LexA|nr:transcriptional repressor LexA [Treponemataceae bacterium]HOQ93235.1 transcriptional repressor LexA [Treponemataceae bacterium]HPM06285.1 transcriptional repressor LexA [Treponemataceae bacterium]HPY53222.1 transcriptional repressor LexA [Treponemataceae bacterium]HQC27120.1 transcriptional repressor LexA [Treponemataceae bacterium]
MKKLTERQEEFFAFICSCIEDHSCPPTVRETAEYFGVSPRAVQDQFTALENKGYVRRIENRSRSLKLLVSKEEYFMGSVEDEESEEEKARKEGISIPILGTVAAGLPLFCEENYSGSLTLYPPIINKTDAFFALNVRGDSMINAGILDGDLAIVKQQSTGRNGQIVVALLDDTVTLKRFYKEPARVLLKPENPKYNPIYCQDVKILGTLVTIIRTY